LKQNEDKIRGTNKASVLLNASGPCINCGDLFLKKMERDLCVHLGDATQKWLSVCGAVMNEKTVPVKAGLETVS
jgi:hypothetical protein